MRETEREMQREREEDEKKKTIERGERETVAERRSEREVK